MFSPENRSRKGKEMGIRWPEKEQSISTAS
jgi:hypothetical protein